MSILQKIARLLDLEAGETYEQRQYRWASERWRRHNEQARLAGCKCGAPATHVQYDRHNNGSVPVEFWACAEHHGAAMWSQHDGNMVAHWRRPIPCVDCSGMCSTSRKIGAAEPNAWYCPTKPETVIDEYGEVIS